MRTGRLLWALTRLAIFLPLTLAGLVLLLVGLVLSPWGTKLALEQAARMDLLSYESVEGAPLDTFDLKGFRLKQGSLRVAVDDLHLSWAEDCLLKGRLCLDQLYVDGAQVRIGKGQADEETEPAPEQPAGDMPQVQLPFPVELRDIKVNDVAVHLADGTRLAWKSFTTGVEAEGSTVNVQPTRLAGLRLTLPLTPGAMLALSAAEQEDDILTAEAIDAAIAVRSPLPSQVAAQAQGVATLPLDKRPRIELPEITLPVAVEVPELLVEDVAIDGAMDYGVKRLDLNLHASGQTVTIEPLSVNTVDADANLQAEVTLSDNYPLMARLDADLYLPERFPALDGERVKLALDGSLAELKVDLDLTGPVEAQLDAQLDALDPTLPFESTFKSPKLQWPLPGMELDEQGADNGKQQDADSEEQQGVGGEGQQPEEGQEKTAEELKPWVATDITLSAKGSLLDYQTQLELDAEGPSLPTTHLNLNGQGDLKHYRWKPLEVTMDAGHLKTEGGVNWAEGLEVEASLDFNGINPEPFVEGLKGDLDGQAQLTFNQTDEGWRVTVPGLNIKGELDERPLTLNAKVSGNSNMRWNIESLDFRQGNNRITAQGLVSQSAIDIAAKLDLPDMASLYPGLAGRLQGDITANGSLKAPELDVTLAGDGVAFQDNRIARLSLDGQVAGIDDPRLDIVLNAQDVEAGGQSFADIDLSLKGLLSQHRLELNVDGNEDGPLNRLALVLDGAMNKARDRYRGTLSPLEVDLPQGNIALDDALSFDANLTQSSVRTEPFCLRRQQGGAVCLNEGVEASPDSGRVVVEVDETPMDLINGALPEGWRIDGKTEAKVVASWSAGGSRWQAQADLDSQVEIAGRDAYGQEWSVPATTLTLDLDASQSRITSALELGLADSGSLKLDLAIQDPMGTGALDGRLAINEVRLAPYRPLATGIDELEGSLDGQISISGNRANPELNGNLNLSGLRVHGADIPLVVTDGDVSIALNNDNARISGYVDAEEGRLNIDGTASWPGGSWEAQVALNAEQDPLLLSMPAYGRLKVAPNLTIRANPERLQVRGDVRVPWARLEVGKVPPSAVTPSSDEIIITKEMDEAAKAAEEEARRARASGEPTAQSMAKAGMAIDIRISLLLGPDMLLEAYGLETELQGKLDVRQVNGPLQLFGDVNLVDGQFKAYGQDLQIREGKIIFSGPPSQPLLDFEAIRNPANTEDGVIAGLRVTGLASTPKLEIFSEPSMEESRALSYVLRGRAPEDGGAGGALTTALIGMTLGKTGGAVGAVGETFGIEDLSLDTAGSGEDSQVVVSGKVTDRLEVGYGVGVFSPIAELTLTYQLWRNLYLRAISGAAQAVDLIYTFSIPGHPPKLE
uniref:autotransporter assembly complex protein TamB n=1 Tax=Halomonas sp. TaxID=1486246 RepID=UPI0026394234|nr:translocation/assembly module TamB domain-containing protein [Halomonas sp.]